MIPIHTDGPTTGIDRPNTTNLTVTWCWCCVQSINPGTGHRGTFLDHAEGTNLAILIFVFLCPTCIANRCPYTSRLACRVGC